MGIGYAVGNVLLAAQEYENWAEVIFSIMRRQEPPKIILKNGLKIEASIGLRYLVREIFFEKIYNPAQLPIEPDDIVVDIGANCGIFTLFATTRTHNKVYAFEPDPANCTILSHNLTDNRLTEQVSVQQCAVSNKEGMTQLRLNPCDGQQNLLVEQIFPEKIEHYRTCSDLNYLLPSPDEAELPLLPVSTTTLQAVMDKEKLERIDFLKLDCEGAEGVILSSTPITSLRKIRKLALEFHDHLSQMNHQELQKLLQVAGFTTTLQWDGRSPLGYIYGRRSQQRRDKERVGEIL